MSRDKVFDGSFWLQDGSDQSHKGRLSVGPGKSPTVRIEGELTPFWAPENKTNADGSSVTVQHPREHETFTGPLMIQGLDSDENPLTLIDAVTVGRNMALFSETDDAHHDLRATQAVVGGCLSSRDHKFSGIRIRLQDTDRWAPLLDREQWASPVTLAGGGTIALEPGADGLWLTISGVPPRSLRDLDRAFLQPTVNLFTLAACYKRGLLSHRVQDSESLKWWDVYTASQLPDDAAVDVSAVRSLLRPTDLRLYHIGRWLDGVETLGPLPTVVADLIGPTAISVESHVLQLTTVAEGLHRALYPKDRRIEDIAVAKSIQTVASDAVRSLHPKAKEYVSGLLSFIGDLGYNARIRKLAIQVEDAVPGVVGKNLQKWSKMVTEARNDFAHRLKKGKFLEEKEIDAYATIEGSLRWLLTGLLLTYSGVDSAILETRFSEFEEYQIFLKYATLWKPDIYPPAGA